MMLELTEYEGGALLSIKVVPGASRTRIAGEWGVALKVQVAAAPEKGKANKELLHFLAKILGVPKTDLKITKGQTHARKEIWVEKMRPQQVRSILQTYLDE